MLALAFVIDNPTVNRSFFLENIQISKWDWPNKIVLINNIVRMLTTSVRVLHVCLAQCTCLDCQGLESTKDKKKVT